MSDNSSLKKKRNYPKDDITSLPGGVLLKIKGSSIPRTSSFCDALVRYLVALMGVFGICNLVVDALRFDVGIFDMLLPCAMFTAAFFVLFTSFKLAILGVFGLAGGTLLMAELAGVSVSKLFRGGVTLIIARISTIMDSLGYVSKSPTYYGYETVEGLLTVSAFITAFVFSLCIRKRSISFIVVAISGAIIIPSYFYGMLKSFGSAVCIICSLCGYHAIAVSEKHGNDRKQSGYSGILALVLAVAILISPIADINKPWAENSRFSSLYVYVEQLIKDLSNGKMPNLGWGTYIPSPNEKRTAKPSARFHIGSKIMDVYSSYNDTVYLRTWAGGKYSDDSWYPVVWNDVLENNPEINNKDAISHLARLIERPMLSDLIDVYEYTEYGEALWSLDIFEREIMVFPYEESNVLAIPSLFTGTDISVKSMIYDGVAVKSSSKNETYIARGYPISLLYNEKAVSVIDELVQGYVQCMKYRIYAPELINGAGQAIADSYDDNTLYDLGNSLYYNESFVDLVYAQNFEDVFIDRAVLELFENDSGIIEYFNESLYPFASSSEIPEEGYVMLNGVILRGSPDGNVYSYTLKESYKPSDILGMAKIVADYLAENCQYDLSPKTSSKASALEDFLFKSREGYCVQFATAGTLMLRRLGIQARYAEGYVATDFLRNLLLRTPGYAYKATVYDKNAHAWSEIYINGIGWVPYEMTPSMSGLLQGDTSQTTTDDPFDITTETTTDVTTDTTTETTEEITSTVIEETTDSIISTITTDDYEPEPTGSNGGISKTVITVIIIAAAISALGATIYYLAYKDKLLKEKRRRLYESAAGSEALNTAERQKLGALLTAELGGVLEAYRLLIKDGEQPSEFAVRLDVEMRDMGLTSLPSAFVDAMSSQVYAGIMSADELKTAAKALSELRMKAKKEIGLLRYISYKIKRIL